MLTYAALLAVTPPRQGLQLLRRMPVTSLQIYSALDITFKHVKIK